jgi:hypothetical protein
VSPTALIFNNVPGSTATQQIITLTNTSSYPEQIEIPSSNSSSFTATSNCSTLPPTNLCTLTVTFTPTTAPVTATLTIPVTSITGTVSTTVPLTGTYTTQTAGLQILPQYTQFSPQPAASFSTPNQFTLNNLTAKSLAITLAFPRQFALTSPPCTALAPNASCTFSTAFVPLTNADITGTLVATGIPTDSSPALTGIAYLEGYAVAPPTTALTISGSSLANGILTFPQLISGQAAQRTLTLTNSSPTALLTIRRITSPWPFPATSTCNIPLAPGATCTITLTYTPLNQVPVTSSPAPALTDTSILTIESDAATSPSLINLTGSSTQVTTSTPSNIPAIATLTPSQSSLTFAPPALGATSTPQTITLANTGTAPLTLTALPPAPEFTLTNNCLTTLAPTTTCTLSIAFTPSATTTASTTVKAGSSATYTLAATPLNGFTGPIALTCAPIVPAPFAICTIQPPGLTLTSTPQTAFATITTVAATAQLTPHSGIVGTIATCLLLPTLLLACTKPRRIPAAWALLATLTLLSLSACGNIITPYLRQSPTTAGTYTYQVTAISTTLPTPITQTVTLTLTVQ